MQEIRNDTKNIHQALLPIRYRVFSKDSAFHPLFTNIKNKMSH